MRLQRLCVVVLKEHLPHVLCLFVFYGVVEPKQLHGELMLYALCQPLGHHVLQAFLVSSDSQFAPSEVVPPPF
jgi:hypothetical protein